MGNNEAGTPKSEKSPSPAQEQANFHAYPDWATIQAYYGPGVTLPPPYFNAAVTSGHPPHPYMWGPPQPMMPPYGTPYAAAIYSHGGVYAHPSVPLGSHGHGIPSSPAISEAMVATPLSIATPAKSPSNKDQGLMKKLKGFDGLAVSIGNGNSGSAAGSHSAESGTEGSSDGSDGNTAEGDKMQRKRSSEGLRSTGKDGKVDSQANPILTGEANAASSRSLGVSLASAGVAGKPVGTVPLSTITPALELRGSPSGKTKTTAATVHPASGAVVPGAEHWIPNERELKRERRKQSNRESARRSRLRKQAESEDLATKVESLNVENLALRSEINRLTENSDKLRIENAALMEKLKNAQLGQTGEIVSDKIAAQGAAPVSTENFLSRVNNSGSVTTNTLGESEAIENSKSSSKLHQLLESSPRTDAVVAG